jgi:hypothetical protein
VTGDVEESVSLPLAELLQGDRIVVTDNFGARLAEVDAPDRLTTLADILEGLGDGWTNPEAGVPVARVRLNFYADGQPHGNLGVGRAFLAAHVRGGFLARESDVDTARSLLRALGVRHLLERL